MPHHHSLCVTASSDVRPLERLDKIHWLMTKTTGPSHPHDLLLGSQRHFIIPSPRPSFSSYRHHSGNPHQQAIYCPKAARFP